MLAHLQGKFSHAKGIRKKGEREMEETKQYSTSKGGRPIKLVKRKKLLGVKCTIAEAFLIRAKAEQAQLSVSEYLREMGLTGKIDIRKKALPKEVLLAIATLHHMAANLNQIAKKRNSFDELNALERAELQHLAKEFKQQVSDIKIYLQ